MRRILVVLLAFPGLLYAQQQGLSLEQAYQLAQQNYPLIKQKDLIKQTSGINT